MNILGFVQRIIAMLLCLRFCATYKCVYDVYVYMLNFMKYCRLLSKKAVLVHSCIRCTCIRNSVSPHLYKHLTMFKLQNFADLVGGISFVSDSIELSYVCIYLLSIWVLSSIKYMLMSCLYFYGLFISIYCNNFL